MVQRLEGTDGLSDRATHALRACPDQANGQRALLHVCLGDLESVAHLLAVAPELGWSREEHPGQPAFWLLARLLAVDGVPLPLDPPSLVVPGAGREASYEIGGLDGMPHASGGPHLTTPNLRALVEMADVERPKLAATRTVLLTALRKAAEQRMAGVTAEKRRRHYGHGARLVAACAVADPTPETAAWVAGVRAKYRRYPALQDEFDHWLNRQ